MAVGLGVSGGGGGGWGEGGVGAGVDGGGWNVCQLGGMTVGGGEGEFCSLGRMGEAECMLGCLEERGGEEKVSFVEGVVEVGGGMGVGLLG